MNNYSIYGDGSMVRNFSYVEDVADIFYQCGYKNVNGMTFNVGSDDIYSLNELSKLVLNISGSIIKPKYLPMRAQEVHSVILDHTQLNKHFNYGNTPIDEAIKKTWDWAKKQGSQEFVFTNLELNTELTPENWKKQ